MTGSGARDGLVAACAASVGIHVALAPEHIRDHLPIGLGFVLASLLLAAAVIGLLRRPAAAWPVGLALVTLAGLVAGYLVTRVAHVPGVSGTPEPWDAVGLFSKAIETAGLFAGWRLSRSPAVETLDSPDPLLPIYVPLLVAVFAALLALSGGHRHALGEAAGYGAERSAIR